jgi:hypothetical protein
VRVHAQPCDLVPLLGEGGRCRGIVIIAKRPSFSRGIGPHRRLLDVPRGWGVGGAAALWQVQILDSPDHPNLVHLFACVARSSSQPHLHRTHGIVAASAPRAPGRVRTLVRYDLSPPLASSVVLRGRHIVVSLSSLAPVQSSSDCSGSLLNPSAF